MQSKRILFAYVCLFLLSAAAPIALNGGSAAPFNGGTTTTQVQAPSGTAAAPAYSFSTDTNSGLYRVAADRPGFAVGGTSDYGIEFQGNANGSFASWSQAAGLLATGPSILGSTTTDNGLGYDSKIIYWNNGSPTAWLEGDASSAQFCFGDPATTTKPCLSPESTSNGVLRFLRPNNTGWTGYVDLGSGYLRSTANSIGFSFGGDTDTGFLSYTFSDYGAVSAGGFSIFTWEASEFATVGSQAYAFHVTSGAGDPTAGDCDADAERGRMYLDTTNNKFYVCGGATRLWDHFVLTDVP